MRRRDLLAALAAGALLGRRAEATPAPDDALPRLAIEPSSRTPRQGSVVALAVRSDRPLASLALTRARQEVPVEMQAGGTLFRALLGIDLDATLGDLPLRLAAATPGGTEMPVTYVLRVVSGEFTVQRLKVARAYVELSPETLERVRTDQAAVAQVWATGDAARRWAGPFARPVDAAPVENFGVRRIFNGQPRAPHNGVDFPAPEGTPVVAPAPARVAMAADLYFSGGTLILDHGAGLFTLYFHLSRHEVTAGDLVPTGARIGAVGSTGRSTGPHLHWGARLGGARVNPTDLLTLPDWGPA
jgi:murein DD-endopeptidase MepM/ murein hydrolase activator NlpD